MSLGHTVRRDYNRIAAEVRSYAPARRYRRTRDALQFLCETHAELPPQPSADDRTLTLFAHFDPHGLVDPYVVYYLEQLKQVGSTIVFVSGSPRLDPVSVDAIRPLCAGIYTRQTLSLDFGSWHLAWSLLTDRGWSLDDFDRFVLANDSVYGPLYPLTEMWSSLTGADMYGSIENLEPAPHLQSFFLAWDLNPRTRPFLARFWADFQYIPNKKRLIRRYEIGLSQQARNAGLTLKPYIATADIKAAVRLSPHHEFAHRLSAKPADYPLYYWDGLIEHLRFPFLKTVVPRDWKPTDPSMGRFAQFLETTAQMAPRHESVANLPRFIREHTAYPYELIGANLERLGCGPPADLPASSV